MQTFLPYPDFQKSAECLDRQRLGKQRVECLQILRALNNPTYGWQNHPAVRMWRGYRGNLTIYALFVVAVWTESGYADTCADKILAYQPSIPTNEYEVPPWLGDPAFHSSHRAALLYKLPSHYSRFGWTEQPAVPNAKGSLPYVWPVV